MQFTLRQIDFEKIVSKSILILSRLYTILTSPFLNSRRVSVVLQTKSCEKKKVCLERKRHKMAALKLNRLKEIILNAYEAGFNGCLDLREEFADEMVAEIMAEIERSKSEIKPGGDWRLWTTEELRKKPIGTIFEHSRLGKGWIEGTSESKKQMTFANGETSFFMQNNVEPWDEPMKLV